MCAANWISRRLLPQSEGSWSGPIPVAAAAAAATPSTGTPHDGGTCMYSVVVSVVVFMTVFTGYAPGGGSPAVATDSDSSRLLDDSGLVSFGRLDMRVCVCVGGFSERVCLMKWHWRMLYIHGTRGLTGPRPLQPRGWSSLSVLQILSCESQRFSQIAAKFCPFVL